jgi:acid stress-induced BolA-like protein IbaG/YrbA
MDPQDIKKLIETGLTGCEATVEGDGSHYKAVVVDPVFEGKSPIEKQKLVYATLGDKITNGEIHALTIKAYTPKEWETAKKLLIS